MTIEEDPCKNMANNYIEQGDYNEDSMQYEKITINKAVGDIYDKKSDIELASPQPVPVTCDKYEYLHLYSFKIKAVVTGRELSDILDSSAEATLVSLD